VNYFSWNQDQWVSFDDARSLKNKVDYANQNGLLGIFIWALDLDDMNHDALNAVLYSKGGLGAFKQQNGVGLSDFTNYTRGSGACFLGECSPTPGCTGPYQAVGHQIRCDQQGMYRQVCCPNTNTPNPNICTWRGGRCKATVFERLMTNSTPQPTLYLWFVIKVVWVTKFSSSKMIGTTHQTLTATEMQPVFLARKQSTAAKRWVSPPFIRGHLIVARNSPKRRSKLVVLWQDRVS